MHNYLKSAKYINYIYIFFFTKKDQTIFPLKGSSTSKGVSLIIQNISGAF